MSRTRFKYYHVDEVARLLQCSVNDVYGLIKEGGLKAHRGGRRWLIDMEQPLLGNDKAESSGEKERAQEGGASGAFVLNTEAERALELIEKGENIFITGKAGTGKTTLLREIMERNRRGAKKRIVTLAPTGVAAENAGGVTMHNFLRLPMKPYLPDHTVLPSLYKLEPGTEEVVRNLDMMIIDEISMARCDMMDATDMILRHYRKNRKPFGGVQLVMLGDLYQLSPVVKPEEWDEMKAYYRFVYFFCCYAFKRMDYKVVELQHIYRQEEGYFKDLLNNIRVADVRKKDLDDLDGRYEPRFRPGVSDNVVTLMTHIKMTDDWNRRMFAKLDRKLVTYHATAHNWWGERFPAEYHLQLKVGARVMFLRNTDDYKNGTMGWVQKLGRDSIVVRKDDGKTVDVEKAKWEQLEYRVDKETKTIFTDVSGSFTQFPLKLAWAVSIHKSQGLTFDEVAIDASKAFTFGQVYVALSRCRRLKGIHLLSKIPCQKITADEVVAEYLKSIDDEGNVHLPEDFEPIKYERGALVLYISRRKFVKIRCGEMREYKHAIDDGNKELMFLHENGKICINRTFAGVKKKWRYTDINGGHCPFVKRQYKRVLFICRDLCQKMDAEIEGYTEIYCNADGVWAFHFRVARITEIRVM